MIGVAEASYAPPDAMCGGQTLRREAPFPSYDRPRMPDHTPAIPHLICRSLLWQRDTNFHFMKDAS